MRRLNKKEYFKKIMSHVSGWEGGYQKIPEDRGNWSSISGELVGTNWGISARFAEDFTRQPWDEEDMEALSMDEAMFIYYWGLYIPSNAEFFMGSAPDLGALYFDSCVNHGISRGIKMLQKSLLNTWKNPPIELSIADGKWGPKTQVGLASYLAMCSYEECEEEEYLLMNAFITVRERFYRDLVENDPSQAIFLNGWLSRVRYFSPVNFTLIPEAKKSNQDVA